LFLKRECAIAATTINHLKLQRKKQLRNIKRIMYETNQMKKEMQLWEKKQLVIEVSISIKGNINSDIQFEIQTNRSNFCFVVVSVNILHGCGPCILNQTF